MKKLRERSGDWYVAQVSLVRFGCGALRAGQTSSWASNPGTGLKVGMTGRDS